MTAPFQLLRGKILDVYRRGHVRVRKLYLPRGIIHNILTIVHKIASYKRWKYIKDNMIIFIDSLIDTE